MWAKPLGILSGCAVAAVLGGTAMAASSIPVTVSNGIVSISSKTLGNSQNPAPSGQYVASYSSYTAQSYGQGLSQHDPSGTTSLTSQPEGTLTIAYDNQAGTSAYGEYVATWNWTSPAPELRPNQPVMLVGDMGTGPVSLSASPATLLFGKASSTGGVAVIDIPASDYFATESTPETFEMFALFSSTPTGQMPEVPVAAALPLAGLVIGGFALYRRRALGA